MEPERRPRLLAFERRLLLLRDELRREELLRADPRDEDERRELAPERDREEEERDDFLRAVDLRPLLRPEELPLRERLRDAALRERELELDLRAAIGSLHLVSDARANGAGCAANSKGCMGKRPHFTASDSRSTGIRFIQTLRVLLFDDNKCAGTPSRASDAFVLR